MTWMLHGGWSVSADVVEMETVVIARIEQPLESEFDVLQWVRVHADVLDHGLAAAGVPEGQRNLDRLYQHARVRAQHGEWDPGVYVPHRPGVQFVVVIPYVEQGTPWQVKGGIVITGYRQRELRTEVRRDEQREQLIDGQRVVTTHRDETTTIRDKDSRGADESVQATDVAVPARTMELMLLDDGRFVLTRPSSQRLQPKRPGAIDW